MIKIPYTVLGHWNDHDHTPLMMHFEAGNGLLAADIVQTSFWDHGVSQGFVLVGHSLPLDTAIVPKTCAQFIERVSELRKINEQLMNSRTMPDSTREIFAVQNQQYDKYLAWVESVK